MSPTNDRAWGGGLVARAVAFLDGERLTGTINRVRKFTFVLDTDSNGSVMVYKIAVKYVSEVK